MAKDLLEFKSMYWDFKLLVETDSTWIYVDVNVTCVWIYGANRDLK